MITIYWSKETSHGLPSAIEPLDPIGLRSRQPLPVRDILDKRNKFEYKQCPAYQDHINNLYYIGASFDYDLFIREDGGISTHFYDQKTFDDYMFIRDLKEKIFSFNDGYLFLADTDSLLLSQIHPYLHSNGFSDNTVLIPGTFDIAKWPRILEASFHMKNDKLSFKEHDPLYYIKFYTNEKIVFKHFFYTNKMKNYFNYATNTKNYKPKVNKLEFFYDLFAKKKRLKKMMLEEAKKNLLE